MKAGDALVFTEALVHGSRRWTSADVRTALVYSYAPGCLAWRNYETVRPYLALARTDLQRDLLRPPYVGDYDEREAVPHGPWPSGRRSAVAFDPPRVSEHDRFSKIDDAGEATLVSERKLDRPS